MAVLVLTVFILGLVGFEGGDVEGEVRRVVHGVHEQPRPLDLGLTCSRRLH